jgi:hypothetical protein
MFRVSPLFLSEHGRTLYIAGAKESLLVSLSSSQVRRMAENKLLGMRQKGKHSHDSLGGRSPWADRAIRVKCQCDS